MAAGALVQTLAAAAAFALTLVASRFTAAGRSVAAHNEMWPLVPGHSHTRVAESIRVRVPARVARPDSAVVASAALCDAGVRDVAALVPSSGALHVGHRFSLVPGYGVALAPAWTATAPGDRAPGGLTVPAASWTTGRRVSVARSLGPAPHRQPAPLTLVLDDADPHARHPGLALGDWPHQALRALGPDGGVRLGSMEALPDGGVRIAGGRCADSPAVCVGGDTHAVGYIHLSDVRRKDSVSEVDPTAHAPPQAVRFRWLDGDGVRLGFIAQDVPWQPGGKRVQNAELLADTVARARHLAARVEALQARR